LLNEIRKKLAPEDNKFAHLPVKYRYCTVKNSKSYVSAISLSYNWKRKMVSRM